MPLPMARWWLTISSMAPPARLSHRCYFKPFLREEVCWADCPAFFFFSFFFPPSSFPTVSFLVVSVVRIYATIIGNYFCNSFLASYLLFSTGLNLASPLLFRYLLVIPRPNRLFSRSYRLDENARA